ncbi:MAG: sugar phosphate isomerase/epimerase family protein [Bacteroidota bacterium]
MRRRRFINRGIQASAAISILGLTSCKDGKKTPEATSETIEPEPEPAEVAIQLSLAQWSIHRMIKEEGLDPYAFAEKAKQWGFSGLEYVSQLYEKELSEKGFSQEAMDEFVQKSLETSKAHGMENLIIMVDHEGDLSAADEAERNEAVEKHQKWVDAAKKLGCHSIRVNLMGSKVAEEWMPASIDGLKKLCAYAAPKNIDVIVENHGGFSSDAGMLVEVMKSVDMDNCGTLPDFGNFCVEREDGSYFESKCIKEYDRYQGITELMPYAKAVSAKSHDFDSEGNEMHTDYTKMMGIVLSAGYKGYLGVEYEGKELSEEDGILATKNLLLKVLETSA